MTKKHSFGFTLIELLVVIAIIALLSTIVFANINAARLKSRDKIRLNNLVQLQNALELYYADHGSYPMTSMAPPASDVDGIRIFWSSTYPGNIIHPSGIAEEHTDYIPGLVPKYISVLPTDIDGRSSQCNTYNRAYWYWSNGRGYKIATVCSMEGDEPRPDPGSRFYSNPSQPLGPNIYYMWALCGGDTSLSPEEKAAVAYTWIGAIQNWCEAFPNKYE